jgi:CxxC motif-containing protein (DUF1111 family)
LWDVKRTAPLLATPLLFLACVAPPPPHAATDAAGESPVAAVEAASAARIALGEELFLHTWRPDDPLSVDGNGLGPVFNAASCVACHSQGGVGGAGGNHLNVRADGGLVSVGGVPPTRTIQLGIGGLSSSDRSSVGLGGLGLRGFGGFGGGRPARNTPALFGAGLIDAISDVAIDEAARAHDAAWPDVKGRVPLDKDGRVARFGWKGDVANLRSFVSQACAAELGLTVPDAAEPVTKDMERSPGLDLDDHGVTALTSFVAALRAPVQATGDEVVEQGRRVFHGIGCASCHKASLGGVDGLYSDLLLHDLGPALSDSAGTYGQPADPEMARFWRTPPLWGVRDSGPWMHDGRATTLRSAIRLHGGEATKSTRAWAALPKAEHDAVDRFLESLVAPDMI